MQHQVTLFVLAVLGFWLNFIVFTGEKKKTKAIDNELNPVWNEVSVKVTVCGFVCWEMITDLRAAIILVETTVC